MMKRRKGDYRMNLVPTVFLGGDFADWFLAHDKTCVKVLLR